MMYKFCLTLLFTALSLWADQAAYISKAKARQVQEILSHKSEIRFLCELCGEEKSQLVNIDNVQAVDVNYENQWEVLVNNQGIDLAYTYIQNHGVWVNLAMFVNEEVDSVSEILLPKHF